MKSPEHYRNYILTSPKMPHDLIGSPKIINNYNKK